jgi:hypothetical protein
MGNAVYDMAIIQIKHWAHKKDVAINNSLRYIMHEKTEDEKRKFLGEEIYFEYLCCKKDLENKKYGRFLSVFQTGLSNFRFDSDKSKEDFLRINSVLSKDFKEDLAIAKIAEEYFPAKNLEVYIKSIGVI